MSIVSGTEQVLTLLRASTMVVLIVATVERMVSNCLTSVCNKSGYTECALVRSCVLFWTNMHFDLY